MEYEDSRRMVYSGYDDFVILTPLPLTVRTEKEAKLYFEQFEVYRPSPVVYESQMYTKRYKLFKRDGRWMAYHWIGFYC